jgi:hypothetical protein
MLDRPGQLVGSLVGVDGQLVQGLAVGQGDRAFELEGDPGVVGRGDVDGFEIRHDLLQQLAGRDHPVVRARSGVADQLALPVQLLDWPGA